MATGPYSKTTWVNDAAPAINAANLQNIEDGLDGIYAEVTTQGDILYATGSEVLQRLAIGSAGQYLGVSGGIPAWSTVTTVWNLISETILSGNAASVTFSSIPGTYRTLAIFLETRSDRAAETDAVSWRVNGDSANNYDFLYREFTSAGETQTAARAQTEVTRCYLTCGTTARASNFGVALLYFDGYASTDREKFGLTSIGGMVMDLSADTEIRGYVAVGHWRSTAAITSITFLPAFGTNFVAGSHFTLYGIT